MQTKSYESVELQALPAVTGINNLTIQNDEQRKENFHGIRFKGRIIMDGVNAPQFGKGFITLMCIPAEIASVPAITSDVVLNDAQYWIIASEIWSMRADTTTVLARYGAIYDFDMIIGTSRTCNKGGRIVAQVTNESASTGVVLTCMLSLFRTTA